MEYRVKDRIQYHGSHRLVIATLVLALLSWLGQFFYLYFNHINQQLTIANIVFGLISISLLMFYLARKSSAKGANFTLVFLISTFSILITLRLSYVAHMTLSTFGYIAALTICILNFLVTAKRDLRESATDNSHLVRHSSRYEWQLLFIRVFIGFDLVPHFCEKLFSGANVRMEDVHTFAQLGVPHPLFFTVLAGLIEFAGAISIGCGFITRLGALSLSIYLMVATYLGHHFSIGFIWAHPGGGWEYPVLWASLIVSFIFFGGGGFSIDRALRDRYQLPKWVLTIMGSRYF